MVFTIRGDSNPLAAFAGGAAEQVAQNEQQNSLQRFQQESNRKKSESVLKALGGLNPQSSSLDWMRAIGSIEDSDAQAAVLKSYESTTKREADLKKFDKDTKNVDMIRKYLGEETADLYPELTVGGQTKLLEAALDQQKRDSNLGDLLKPESSKEGVESRSESPQQEKSFKPGPPKGLTPKEKVDWSESRRKENLPRFQEAVQKQKARKRDQAEFGVLKKLNEKGNLPSGFSKSIINPETGEPYQIAQLAGVVHPDVQRWVKTINDFTQNAKESYGSRVTNFDLQQFLKRFPGLLNTPEGRKQILEQMQLVSELDNLYDTSFANVIKKYGMGNISIEDADAIAQREISEKEDEIVARIAEIGSEAEFASGGEVHEDFPDPAKYNGKRYETEDGQFYRSNGKEWVKEG